MFKHVLILGFLAIANFLPGQTSDSRKNPSTKLEAADEARARAATENLKSKYGLNADQAKQVYQIQTRKLRNLKEIEPLKNQNPALWRAKAEAVQKGALTSFKRTLRSKTQIEIFEKTRAEERRLKAEKRRELVLKGASKTETEAALLEIHLE